MSKELRVSILDNRAAVLEKLALAAAAAATVATATSSTSSTSSTSTAATSADTTTEAQSEYYRRALGDARTMVAVLDRSPTGYLRTGKLLQRMRQWDEAVEMYRLGIHNCSDPDAKHVWVPQPVHPVLLQGLTIFHVDVGGDAQQSSQSAKCAFCC